MTRSTPQLAAIIFDYGGVLTFPPTAQDWQSLAEIVGAPMSSFHEAYWRDRNDYDMAKFDSATYWQKVAHEFGRKLTLNDIHKLISLDNEQWGRANTKSIDVALAAHASGLKIAILSNIQSDMLSFVRSRHAWFSDFDIQVFSCDLGIAKPSPESFLHTGRLLHVLPEECLFVDDRQANIDGAKKVGMKAIRFDIPQSPHELEQLLLEQGVALTMNHQEGNING